MKFKNYISLGYSCPVAASMSKYGLRSFSAPFDWLVTKELSWVLHYIENDFEGFLKFENLELFPNDMYKFKEMTSDFLFVHEEYRLNEEYISLMGKYKKKIDNFISQTKMPCCFIRTISDESEINYIQKNSSYIKKVIQKNNENNQIVFLVKDNIPAGDFPFQYWVVKGEYSGDTRELLRGWFDTCSPFLEWCAEYCDSRLLMKNIIYDNQKQEKYILTVTKRYETLLSILKCDFSKKELPENIIIYGAGNLGKAFYERVKEVCKVKCFIDRNANEESYDDIPIVCLGEIEFEKRVPVVVSAAYDYDNIMGEIMRCNKNVVCISLEDFLR